MDSPRSDISMRSLSNSQSSLSTTSCSSTFASPIQTPRPIRDRDKISDYETLLVAIEFLDVTLCPLLKESLRSLPNRHQYDEIIKNCVLKRPLANTEREIVSLLDAAGQILLALKTMRNHVVEEYKKNKTLEQEKLSREHDKESSDLCAAYLEQRSEPQKKLQELHRVYCSVEKDINSENLEGLSLRKKVSLKLSGEKFQSLKTSYQSAVNELAIIDHEYQKNTRKLVEKYDKLSENKRAPLKEATKQVSVLLKEIVVHFEEMIGTAEEILNKHNKLES